MNSFIFPEDLDAGPIARVARPEPRPSKIQHTLPAPSIKRRPVPIIVPDNVDFSAYLHAAATKPKDDVVVSVTRFSLDERSPRLQNPHEKKSPGHTRWKSASLRPEQEHHDLRAAFTETRKAVPRQKRLDTRNREQRTHRGQLAPLAEHERDGRRSPADYGVAHVVF